MQITTNNLMSLNSDHINNQKTNNKSRYKSAEIESPAVKEMTRNTLGKGDPVQYYLDLCKEFPNIAFRMSDHEAKMAAGNPGPGYERNSYQSNPDYSNADTYSMEIDVKILKRMMNDSDFEMRIKGMISYCESTYDTYVNDSMNSTYAFGHIFIQEEKGELVSGFALYQFKASTDEEIKLMYEENGKEETESQQSIHVIKDSMQDNFMEMLDKSRLKMNHANELTKEKLLDQALTKDRLDS